MEILKKIYIYNVYKCYQKLPILNMWELYKSRYIKRFP
jgi:hypothetical protein